MMVKRVRAERVSCSARAVDVACGKRSEPAFQRQNGRDYATGIGEGQGGCWIFINRNQQWVPVLGQSRIARSDTRPNQ